MSTPTEYLLKSIVLIDLAKNLFDTLQLWHGVWSDYFHR